MAQSATINSWTENRFISSLQKTPAKFLAWLCRIAENNPSYKEMQFLSSLSDEQLAKRGIRRDEIALHAFRGRLIG